MKERERGERGEQQIKIEIAKRKTLTYLHARGRTATSLTSGGNVVTTDASAADGLGGDDQQ